MKVLLLNSICGNGSTGRIVRDLWNTLKLEGHDVKIAYGLGYANGVEEADCICYNNKIGYYIHNIAAKITDKTGLFSTKQTKKLIKKIKEFNPDVIHLHQLHGYHINYKVLFEYLSMADKKVIWTLHDCWAFTGHCAHFSFNKCEKWKIGCNSCKFGEEYPVCFFNTASGKNYNEKKERFTAVKNLSIVTPSQWLANIVKQSFLCDYPITVINNGIDVTVFTHKKSNFKEKNKIQDKKIVLAVANIWDEKKGLIDIIRLAEMLNDEYKVVIVGLDKKQLKYIPNDILGIIRTNSIQELREIYSVAEVFINLTYEDTFPTVNIEALACGTPIITYNTGGSPEILVDESCGFIVEQGNIAQIAEIINNGVFPVPQIDVNMFSRETFCEKHMELYLERS